MTTQTIPLLPDVPHFEQTTNLDGTDYLLRFRYNSRMRSFFVSLYLPDGTEIAKGHRCVCNWPIFRDVVSPNMPPGVFLFLSSNPSDDTPPDLGELGGDDRRCQFVYMPASDA